MSNCILERREYLDSPPNVSAALCLQLHSDLRVAFANALADTNAENPSEAFHRPSVGFMQALDRIESQIAAFRKSHKPCRRKKA